MLWEGDDVLIDVREASERLRVSRTTVRRMIDAGELPHVKIRDRILLRAVDVNEFVDRNLKRRGPNTKAA
jgi:excisionase family DNA binding protein